LVAIEEALYQTKNQSSQDPLHFTIRLNNKLAALGGVVAGAEMPPTHQSYAVYDELATQIDLQLQKLAQIMKTRRALVQSARSATRISRPSPSSRLRVRRRLMGVFLFETPIRFQSS
jgi:hypothetical protein